MRNRKKLPRQRRAAPHFSLDSLASVKPTTTTGSGFNQLARKTCTECDAPVRWVDAAAAAAHGFSVNEAIAFLGGGSADTLEFWVCTNCDNAGVMGGMSPF